MPPAGWATYSSVEACAAALAPIEKVKSKTLPIIAAVNDFKSIPQTQVQPAQCVGATQVCAHTRTHAKKGARAAEITHRTTSQIRGKEGVEEPDLIGGI